MQTAISSYPCTYCFPIYIYMFFYSHFLFHKNIKKVLLGEKEKMQMHFEHKLINKNIITMSS